MQASPKRSMLYRCAVVATLAMAVSASGASAEKISDLPGQAVPKTSFSVDASDLWWNPSESGWGMQLVQQADFIFATLFVYGTDNKPTWVTAQLSSTGASTWGGPLYVTSGPWFGGNFDPTTVTVRQAGSMTLNFAASGTAASLSYSIDGVNVTKQIQRQLLRVDNYNGAYIIAINLTQSSCTNPASNGTAVGALTINVTQTPSNMTMLWQFGNNATCTYGGPYTQLGKFGSFVGPYSCSTGETGTMQFSQLTNGVGMLSGRLAGASNNAGCQYSGHFTGLASGTP